MGEFKSLTWPEFCAWVQGKTVKTQTDSTNANEITVWIHFTDASCAKIQALYDGPYSEYTPGDGLEMPSVHVCEAPG